MCPPGTYYSLDLEVRRGVCALLEDAGYVTLDAATQRLYQNLYGPFTLLDHTPLAASMSQSPPPSAQGSAAIMSGSPDNLVSHSAGLSQQVSQPGLPGHAIGAGGAGHHGGHGAIGQRTQHGSSFVTEITLGGVPVSGPRGQEAVFGGHHAAGHPRKMPHSRNHFHRGHNLGPIRHYKFNSLSKHFMPTRLDLSRLHATRGHNHLVRPFPAKTHRGATAPAKVKVVPTRLLAQAILSGHSQHADLPGSNGFITETREAEDESLEIIER